MKHSILTRACLAVLLVSIVAGMSFAGASKDASSGSKGIVTLSVFNMWALSQADYERATVLQDYLREHLGVTLQIRESPGGNHEQFLTTQVAANDMADLFSFREPSVIANVIGSGKLVNFNDHKAKLPSIFTLPIYANAIDYMTATYGGANKGLYAMPIRIGPNSRIDRNVEMRYDIWKAAGSPKIDTLEDMLPALKKMQDYYPVNADGQKVYGFALWSEWDKVGIAPITYMERSLGYDNEYASNAVSIYVDGSKAPVAITDKAGPYYRILKFCFNANQMGLLDPDSLTHRYEAMGAKDQAGRYLYHTVFWQDQFNASINAKTGAANNKGNIGFAPVIRGDTKCIGYADYPIGESMNVWGIPKNSKNLDKALEFFNWWWSYEGADFMANGPRGTLWDVDSSGLRYLTEKGWDLLSKPATDGGWQSLGVLAEGGISERLLNPATGNKQRIGYSNWDTTISRSNAENTLLQTWFGDWGKAVSYDDWFEKNPRYMVKENLAIRAMPAMPTDIENKTNNIAEVVKSASWSAIYASSEAEFNRIWDDCIAKADGLGMQDVLKWTTDAWNQVRNAYSKYKLPAGTF